MDCTEIGFDERSWFTTTDESGFRLDLPRTEMLCRVGPPGDRTDLAQGRVEFDPRNDPQPVFALTTGVLFEGRVTNPEGPEAYATIDVRTPEGDLLARGTTNDQGHYNIRAPDRHHRGPRDALERCSSRRT